MRTRSSRPLTLETLETRRMLDGASLSLTPLGPGASGVEWEQVIVSLDDSVQNPRATAELLLSRFGGALGHVYEHALQGFSAQIPAPAVQALGNNPVIDTVEADFLLHSSSQIIPTGVRRIEADMNEVGGVIGEGKQINVNIAIIDSGIAPDHPDLNVVGGRRFHTETSGPPPRRGVFEDDNWHDDNGHGTHVAGIAAAMDNGNGVAGVAPGASLWAVKVLAANGSGNISDIIKGVDWVTQNAGTIEVANMSLGGQGWSTALHTAIQNSVAAGIVYVVAAGNGWRDIHGGDKIFGTSDDTIPAAYPEVATISAFADSDGMPGGLGPDTSWGQYGRDDAWWGPSNFSNSDEPVNQHFLDTNPVNSPGLGIDLVLPGVDILSTYLNGGYATASGTSMAAPHAAGLVALHIHEHGRANNATEVHAVRQSLIDQGHPWDGDKGLTHTWGPDKYQEHLGWAGPSPVPPEPDLSPVVEIVRPGVLEKLAGTVEIIATAQAMGEGNVVSNVEFLVDGQLLGSGVFDAEENEWRLAWDTATNWPDGVYELSVVATDTLERTGTDSRLVEIDNDNVATLDVSLSGSALEVNRNFWRASVTVTIESGGSGVADAVVTGRWSNSSADVVGSTDVNGKVGFTTGNIHRNSQSVDFHVVNIEIAGFEYTGSDAIRVFSTGDTIPLPAGAAQWVSLDSAYDPVSSSADMARSEARHTAHVDQLMELWKDLKWSPATDDLVTQLPPVLSPESYRDVEEAEESADDEDVAIPTSLVP